ncbi:MAG TPA: Asp-tRNA(Asn)/Glu-tRNA(Gln) amidotransferase GatCAB subunit A [Clostridiaceae bacterium]|nr:Asp-tRNA(Asn)/Glu-tRNA(Gln) amidotransferase GatCAB subunit A [Clostridiaceae bacterium]
MENFLTAHKIHDLLVKKQVTDKELVDSCIERIEKYDGTIGAYLNKNYEEARKAADKVDEKISKGEEIGCIEGVPFALKDNICTKGIPTTCASKMLEGFVPPYDASVTEKLYKARAVLIGKTNMDEFAMGSSNENSAFKKVKNPWDIDRVPGGSSGGSAAAVASGEAAFALGTDTGGSVRQPASLCGLAGLKPTYGLVSRYGLIAFASSLDQISPFTRDVHDMALILNAIAGYDAKDSTSYNRQTMDYRKALTGDIRGMKIGIPVEYFKEGIDEKVKKSVFEAIDIFKSLGTEVFEVSLPHTEYSLAVYYILSSAEASSNLARYDGIKYGYRAKDYTDAIDIYTKSRSKGFGDEVKRRIMLGTYVLSAGYYDAYYKKAMKVRSLIKQDFEDAFKKCDILISPTSPTTAFKIGEKTQNPLSMYMSDICTVPINIAGVCGMSLPCGFLNNLPVGMQLIGNYFDEYKLIKAGYAFQKNTNYHKMTPEIREGE